MAALLLVAVAWPAQAQMYKCTNERGVVQYTDKPSAGCKEVDIRSSAPISGALQSPSEDLARQEAEFRKRQIDREASELEERKSQLDRCARMRRELALLNTSRRVVRIDERGEREFMDDSVRDQKMADLQREIARCP
jgi:response regulator RpfG family c-di-GMP phosphodiesterase